MKIAVIGAGAMGGGIAQVCALAGHTVVMRDMNEDVLERSLATIGKSIERVVRKKVFTEAQGQAALSRIQTTTALEQAGDADVVIEAVFENIAVKREVWEVLSDVVRPDAFLASNTSSLSITEIASFVSRPERFCGLHFFNPVPMMALVEVVRALQSTDETVEQMRRFVLSIGKTPIVCEDKPGFIVNRLLVPYINDAVHALAEGVASAEDIDTAMKLGTNMPIGPLALADLVGLDVALAASESLYHEFGDGKFRVAPLLKQLVRAGRLGRKTGEGFYVYDS